MGYQGIAAPVLLLRCGVLGLGVSLGACDVPKEINPVWIYDQVSGRADRARPAPPGLDQPYPNLASVPPRPEKPPLAMREQLTAALAEERARSREPLLPRADGGLPSFQAAPGTPPLPGAPPAPPQLAGARPIPWDDPLLPQAPAARPAAPVAPTPDAPGAPPRGRPVAPAAAPEAPLAPMPGAPPAAPPPDLLGPPPLPPAELLAPAPTGR